MNKGKQMTLAAIAAVAMVAFADARSAVTVTASLKDGSTVKGDFLTKKITGATLFEKNLVLAPSIVRSINFTGTNGDLCSEVAARQPQDSPYQLPLTHPCIAFCRSQGRFFRRTRLSLHLQLS